MAIFNTVYGGEPKWKPNANTIAYYPLTSSTTTSDIKWWYNLTVWHSSPTFWTYQWVDCAKFNGSNNDLYNNSLNPWAYGHQFTISLYAYFWWWSTAILIWNVYKTGSNYYNFSLWKNPNASYINMEWVNFWTISTNSWWWHNLVVTCNERAVTTYVNWVQQNTGTLWLSLSNNWVWRLWVTEDGWNYYYYFNGWLSNVIVENKIWTSTEVSNYYNQTKWLYS